MTEAKTEQAPALRRGRVLFSVRTASSDSGAGPLAGPSGSCSFPPRTTQQDGTILEEVRLAEHGGDARPRRSVRPSSWRTQRAVAWPR
jgi:hypothetical protein